MTWDSFESEKAGNFVRLSWPRGRYMVEADATTFYVRADCEDDAAEEVRDYLGQEGEFIKDDDGEDQCVSTSYIVRGPTEAEHADFTAALAGLARWEEDRSEKALQEFVEGYVLAARAARTQGDAYD